MLFRRDSNSITTKVVGGLGNQLFCYFAGLNLARLHNVNLTVDVSDLKNGLGAHDVTLESLTLEGNFKSKNYVNANFARVINKVLKLAHSKFSSQQNYISTTVGFDSKVLKLNPGTNLYGYFQSYRYFDNVKQNLKSIEIKEPSQKYLEIEEYIKNNHVLSIHVRRGDYVKHKSLYGLLGKGYYLAAFEKIKHLCPNLETWIFSDDVSTAKNLLIDCLPANSVWVQPDLFKDDAEVLMAMSKSKAFIIANSTFSWWAAMLSEKNAVVVAPADWYQGMEDPEDLIPDNWIKVESCWEL